MHELGPSWVPYPERASALITKTPFSGALLPLPGFGVFDQCVVDTDKFLSLNFQCLKASAQVDRITATACRFPADRAITKVKWVGMFGQNAEVHAAAMT